MGPRFVASTLAGILAIAVLLARPSPARAGGFDEMPDQGAQAMGRGATFTAKADDATALYHNVAGLAGQRGTNVQLSANVHVNTFYFARRGRYAGDPGDPATPWAGKPFPVINDKNTSFLLPMLVATTDLGLFEKLTFGAGVFGPAATGRTFQLGVKGMPSPARYDFVQSDSKVLFPTLGAGYRITTRLDVGVSGHLVVADLKEMSIAYADAGGKSCKSAEYLPCDAQGTLEAKGLGMAASVGVLARPSDHIQIGAQLRSPGSVKADGTVTTKLAATTLKPGPASVTLDLPWIARVGTRYIGRRPASQGLLGEEAWDVELDGTYEAWSSAQGTGPTVTTDTGVGSKATVVSEHRWKDTFSLRVGGAYNVPLEDGVLRLRAGAFYDSSATDSAWTRIDVNTLAKVAGTVGVGYTRGAFTVNAAYGAVMSLSRVVTDGELRPSNGAKGGRNVDGNDQPMPAVNNGEYRAFSHVLSFSVEVSFDAIFGGRRKPKSPATPSVDDEEETARKADRARTASAPRPVLAFSQSRVETEGGHGAPAPKTSAADEALAVLEQKATAEEPTERPTTSTKKARPPRSSAGSRSRKKAQPPARAPKRPPSS